VKLGSNVSEGETAGTYCADTIGYVYLLRGLLAVVPPVWVSKEKTDAYFLQFRLVGRRPQITSEHLLAVMEMEEVRHGI
jgi:hypothetical protein